MFPHFFLFLSKYNQSLYLSVFILTILDKNFPVKGNNTKAKSTRMHSHLRGRHQQFPEVLEKCGVVPDFGVDLVRKPFNKASPL